MPSLPANPAWVATDRRKMKALPYALKEADRTTVLEAIREVCLHRGWHLIAAHVHTTHVHVVVEGEASPERMMRDFKGYCSRALNLLEPRMTERERWTQHGSTRWLWKPEGVSAAAHYVIEEQGDPMAVTLDCDS
jgi:REP element-mobilizing transposase RayT